MTPLPESLHVLRRRDFRLLFAGQTISVLGDRMVAVALAFAVLGIGGSPSEVGLVLAAKVLPSAATALAGGVLADRVSRRTVMVGADLVRVASQGTMAVLLVSGSAEVWMLALLAGSAARRAASSGQPRSACCPRWCRRRSCSPRTRCARVAPRPGKSWDR